MDLPTLKIGNLLMLHAYKTANRTHEEGGDYTITIHCYNRTAMPLKFINAQTKAPKVTKAD